MADWLGTCGRIALDDERDYLVWRVSSGGTIEIVDIAVGTERGKGKGRRLVEEVLTIARASGSHLVFAITRAENAIAREFYGKLGFREVATLPGFYREGDAVMYAIDVNQQVQP